MPFTITGVENKNRLFLFPLPLGTVRSRAVYTAHMLQYIGKMLDLRKTILGRIFIVTPEFTDNGYLNK